MHHFSVRRRSLTVAALSAASVLVACTDKRVKQLDTGITRDSALSIMSHDLPVNAGHDSLPNIYKREQFLIAGKQYEVLYFNSENKKLKVVNGQKMVDSLSPKELTPVVFVENRMIGRGWDFWDSVAKKNNIPIKKP